MCRNVRPMPTEEASSVHQDIKSSRNYIRVNTNLHIYRKLIKYWLGLRNFSKNWCRLRISQIKGISKIPVYFLFFLTVNMRNFLYEFRNRLRNELNTVDHGLRANFGAIRIDSVCRMPFKDFSSIVGLKV